MDCDIMIIGAGVVGLAVAENLSRRFHSVMVVERHSSFGRETSSRNSEVIHAGIYYPADSLKAKLCVPGNASIYAYCRENRIPHRKTGKYIISVDNEELPALDDLLQRALANGVTGIRRAGLNELKSAEPHIRAVDALFSADTGIIDSHSLMKSLEQKSLANGCSFAYKHTVTAIDKISGGYSLCIAGPDGEDFTVNAGVIVNSAGLDSDMIAAMTGIDIDTENYRLSWCRGHYFRISPAMSYLAKHLIYPVPPTDSGLGIHVTPDLNGGLKLGPDTMYLTGREQDYSVPASLADKFFVAANRYLPGLSIDDISPDQSGIRPKLQRSGEKFRDFVIAEESSKGLPGFINLIGIESPGLTCCLEIADLVSDMV